MRIAYAGLVVFVMWVIFINAAVCVSSATDDDTLSTDVITKGNIITAPAYCPPMQKRDRRNRCRRVYKRWYDYCSNTMCPQRRKFCIFNR